MEIKNIKDIKNLYVVFTIKREEKLDKTVYVSDAEITDSNNKEIKFENVSLRDILFYLGQAVVSEDDMQKINKYIYDYTKMYLERIGETPNLKNPGYLTYHKDSREPEMKPKEKFLIHTPNGYTRYKSFKELFDEAQENEKANYWNRLKR